MGSYAELLAHGSLGVSLGCTDEATRIKKNKQQKKLYLQA